MEDLRGRAEKEKKRQDNHRRDVEFDFLPRYRRGRRRHHTSKAQGIAWLGGGTTLLGGATLRQMNFGDADLINQEAILERPWIWGPPHVYWQRHTYPAAGRIVPGGGNLVEGTWCQMQGWTGLCKAGGPLSSLEEMGCFQD